MVTRKTKAPVAKKPVDMGKAVSVMGRKQFDKEVKAQVMSGVDPNEAADLIARKKLKGMI